MPKNEEKYEAARLLFCNYLSEIAKEKNISQEEIAMRTGFTQSNVSRMLAGKYSPSLDNFMRLADALGVYFFIIDKDAGGELTEQMKNRWRRPDDSN